MITLIAVIGKNRELGYKKKLLWKLPKDMARFRKITMGKTLVVGRKTFESMGNLFGRKLIVLSRSQTNKTLPNSFFVIGGGEIYRNFIKIADRLILTIVDDSPKADTFFPEYEKEFYIIRKESGIDNGYNYKFLILDRIK